MTETTAPSNWPSAVLAAIAESDDLHVSPLRDDGITHGTPTWIWSVVIDGSLYVRPWNGRRSRWYRAAVTQQAGRIRAAGTEHEVRFEQANPSMRTPVSAAYERKYASSPYLPPMLQDGRPAPPSASLLSPDGQPQKRSTPPRGSARKDHP
ncbi:DUF2255 domain-containing protein [Rathayibacter caricis DSM 15933]|uniref:DUF2255 domain-containing protein n=1 Tax=Rathayibacter caricis DSM 15933 TaxID=1328867 RepID=A0A2T4UQW9_9MICO|nr:DUF2255 family protein [Rathayibacter caricis]PTL71929.1 DUF2255 domain-containing protein [Rathayibacter caricis DSM 15933]